MTLLGNRGYQNLITDVYSLIKTDKMGTTVTEITIDYFITLDTTQASIDRFDNDICVNFKFKRL